MVAQAWESSFSRERFAGRFWVSLCGATRDFFFFWGGCSVGMGERMESRWKKEVAQGVGTPGRAGGLGREGKRGENP